MLKPLHDNVVIEKIKEETKTQSGIILSDKPKEEPSMGLIKALGPGKLVDGKVVEINLKEGQKVIFKRYGGTEITLENKTYLIIAEEDILAVVEEEK